MSMNSTQSDSQSHTSTVGIVTGRHIAARFLIPVGIFVVLFSLFVMYRTYNTTQRYMQQLMDRQAALALEFDLAIRNYIGSQVRPRMAQYIGEDEFIPETMSTSFVARSIFEKVREKFPEYIIRFSSDNPRNPVNLAGPDEQRIIDYFNANPDVKRWTGRLEIDGLEYHAHFNARRMKASCLQCHGVPGDAPASLLDRYGNVAGFYRPVGEVIALDTIAIPTSLVQAPLETEIKNQAAVMAMGLLVLFAGIAILFRRVVSLRLSAIAAHFRMITKRPDQAAISLIGVDGCDEISELATSFNTLATRVSETQETLEQRVNERTTDLATANADLQKEISERREAEERLRESERRLRVKLDYVMSVDTENADLELLDLIELDDLQRMQDAFAQANGVASLISHIDGRPLTEPSNFCGVCDLIRQTKKGRQRCIMSDKILGEKARESMQPAYEQCHSCGFVDASAPIIVGGRHIANWLIGQCNVAGVDRERIIEYAREIDADTEAMVAAYDAMDSMPLERFEKVLDLLWLLARKISTLAYSNLSLVKDIGQRKQVEDELRQTNTALVQGMKREKNTALELEAAIRQLEAASREAQAATVAKSEFLANMSHEIRTPMTAILGYAEILLDSSIPAETHVQAAQTIRRNGEHLLQIINDILDISKIEAGKFEIETLECNPVRIATEAVSLMQVRATSKGLNLQVEYLGRIPATIHTDPMRLRQVLINLIGNAIKFTEHGEVRLRVTFDNDSGQVPRLRFDVIDSGIGMTASQLARLFRPFEQGDTSTTRIFGGTGLGLTISKRLAEQLGGDIVVQSTLHKGSTFSVSIAIGSLDGVELLVPPEADPASPASLSESCSDKKPETVRLDCDILLAEDGPDNQRLISFILQKAGARVRVVGNGKLAIAAALEAHNSGRPYDLILMDMQMPVLDGYRATQELRRLGYAAPIVSLTAHAMEGDREKCLQAGCDEFATKPINRREFLSLVHSVVTGERRQEASQSSTEI